MNTDELTAALADMAGNLTDLHQMIRALNSQVHQLTLDLDDLYNEVRGQ